MKVGMIGLGKMGGNMAERLRRHGHEVVGMDPNTPEADARSVAELVPLLRERFYSCFVTHIGSEVSITGTEIDLEKLREFFVDQQLDEVAVKFVRPSLVDAMHYHLKKVH